MTWDGLGTEEGALVATLAANWTSAVRWTVEGPLTATLGFRRWRAVRAPSRPGQATTIEVWMGAP